MTKLILSVLVSVASAIAIGEAVYIFNLHARLQRQIVQRDMLYLSSAQKALISAIYVREQNGAKLLEHLDNTVLPASVDGIYELGIDKSQDGLGAQYFLWRTKRYYLDYGLELPEKLAHVPDIKPPTKYKIGNRY